MHDCICVCFVCGYMFTNVYMCVCIYVYIYAYGKIERLQWKCITVGKGRVNEEG